MVLGGLGLFLFGMKMMSDGLKLAAGDRLQTILQRATSNRFLAVIVGILATIVINSSTAVTIMTVSFVNSGMMNLMQAIGIIMGANVGTTFSAQLVAFRLDTYAPLFIFIGIMLHMFFKKRNIRNIGYIVLGFGVLFFGITVMGTPLRGLADDPSFNTLLTTFENPLLAILAGFAFTAVVQSSSATMGLLVTLHIAGVPIPFETSAFIILGINIGTSITTVIASIPANRQSKRAATFHIMFDIIGTTIFGLLIFIFPAILSWFQATWSESARQVAMFHTLYNIATLLLILPFVKYASRLMEKIIPLKPEEMNAAYEKKLLYLDTNTAPTAATAVFNAHLEVCRMGKIANENLALALDAFFEKDADKANKVFEHEKVVDYLNHNIASKLVWINNTILSNPEAEKVGKMFQLLLDIERIGDHAENIAEYALCIEDNNIKFSDAATQDLMKLGALTTHLTEKALSAYELQDESHLQQTTALEEEIDSLAAQCTENHISRLKTESCDPKGGIIFTDMIIDLERSADHAYNIASAVKK